MTPAVEDVLEDVVVILQDITSSSFLEEPIIESDGEIGKLSAALQLRDGSRLFALVYVDMSSGYPAWQHYSFQYVDANAQPIFRYDNAPHYPYLPYFPHHKHEGLRDVVPTRQPSARKIVDEVLNYQRRVHPEQTA